MIKNIFLAIIVAIGGVVGYAATQPDNFRLERSITIAAPAKAVFEKVNTLTKWQEFSPWYKMDPAAKTTFEGPAAGAGAKMIWDSQNGQVGGGSMTIAESRANEFIRFDLEMTRPFQAKHSADFTFKTEDKNTQVTWGMSAKRDLMFKIMGVVFNCDKMLGGHFDQGLADLKSVVEAKK